MVFQHFLDLSSRSCGLSLPMSIWYFLRLFSFIPFCLLPSPPPPLVFQSPLPIGHLSQQSMSFHSSEEGGGGTNKPKNKTEMGFQLSARQHRPNRELSLSSPKCGAQTLALYGSRSPARILSPTATFWPRTPCEALHFWRRSKISGGVGPKLNSNDLVQDHSDNKKTKRVVCKHNPHYQGDEFDQNGPRSQYPSI